MIGDSIFDAPDGAAAYRVSGRLPSADDLGTTP
jgi:hypothetical protein